MKNRLPYHQLVLGLDKLFFGDTLNNMQQAEERIDTIDAYMESCGWTWDELINYNEVDSVSN